MKKPSPPARFETPPDLSPSHSLLATTNQYTPARLFRSQAGSSLLTKTQLDLRFDHAAAVDAVYDEADMVQLLPAELVAKYQLFEVQTRTESKRIFLANPDLGRSLSDDARHSLEKNGTPRCDIQIFIGDGLSTAAVRAQVPSLLPLLIEGFGTLGHTVGRCFFVKYCRVGVLNDVGRILSPQVAILLIGERPGLSTAESVSAYMAFRPKASHTDADRNLISNIHGRGILPEEAVARIISLATAMIARQISGVDVKEGPFGKNLTS